MLNRQYGVVEFGPLKPLFLAGYRSAHAYISLNPVLAPLQLHIRRNPEESSPSKVLPVMLKSIQVIRSSDLMDAYKLVAANKLQDAAAAFRSILLSLLIVVPSSPSEVTQVSISFVPLFHSQVHIYRFILKLTETVAIAREYLLGVSIELERRRLVEVEPSGIRRNLELAAYFTHCELQPPHLKLALRNAANVNTKAKNYATAAKFARRLLDLKPDAKIVAQVYRSALRSSNCADELP